MPKYFSSQLFCGCGAHGGPLAPAAAQHQSAAPELDGTVCIQPRCVHQFLGRSHTWGKGGGPAHSPQAQLHQPRQCEWEQ